MKIYRGIPHAFAHTGCTLTIGNFDGVHRGHQAMLALLRNEARQRGLPSCVVTFEPHPRDYFAQVKQRSEIAPARIATLRDKIAAIAANGVEHVVILPFNARLAALSASDFVHNILVQGLQARYVLVGDDFRFGDQRTGDYAMLDALGTQHGFAVARMQGYEVHGSRVSSSAVRHALHTGAMQAAMDLLGRPYTISGHVLHGNKLGRTLNSPTLNLHFAHWKPAAAGIFVVQVRGLTADGTTLPGVANLGIRPSLDANDVHGKRVLLETHCLHWPDYLDMDSGYGKIICVELLHKLHDERKYASLEALQQGIAQDCADARAWFADNGNCHIAHKLAS